MSHVPGFLSHVPCLPVRMFPVLSAFYFAVAPLAVASRKSNFNLLQGPGCKPGLDPGQKV